MLIFSFPDLVTALRKIPYGEEGRLFRHELEKDQTVEPHVEDKDEWILATKGSFFILNGGNDTKIKPDELKMSILMTKSASGFDGTAFELNGNDWLVILIPAGVRHGLVALSALDYFVIKS